MCQLLLGCYDPQSKFNLGIRIRICLGFGNSSFDLGLRPLDLRLAPKRGRHYQSLCNSSSTGRGQLRLCLGRTLAITRLQTIDLTLASRSAQARRDICSVVACSREISCVCRSLSTPQCVTTVFFLFPRHCSNEGRICLKPVGIVAAGKSFFSSVIR